MKSLLNINSKKYELGCGQGRDSLFFASKGLNVYAIDSSKVAIENLATKAKELHIDINLKNINAKFWILFIVVDNFATILK